MKEKIEQSITSEIYRAIEILGGMSDILGIINSYKRTLPDKLVLDMLKSWNKQYSVKEKKNVFSHIYT